MLILLSARSASAADAEVDGPAIYRAQCSECHGASGEGTDEYEKRLEGGLSVAQLAEVIGETMPEADPGSLSNEESRAVAAYVHETFYSAIAQQRNRPARIELARLTVRQYRQVVSDLVASFRKSAERGESKGLTAEYFRGRQPGGRRDRATSRIDAQVDFDFGDQPPVPEIDDAQRYSARWTGAVYAPETGDYEFVVRTENAARLWLNDLRSPVIDAWVKSGDDTEYSARLFLIGGNVYPLRLEFTKAKQGVDDSNKDKKAPAATNASISLLWKHPRGVLRPIASRQLSPDTVPERFICTTPFPPDDSSYGWERGTSVSKAWDQATTNAAIEMAGYVAAELNELAGTKDDDKNRADKIRAFCQTFAARAFRQPLSDEQVRVFINRQFSAADSLDLATKRVLLLVLKSPRFLFREAGGGPDPYDVAARLSFGLWDSIPDDELLEAAARNQLTTRQQVAGQAERMLADDRAKAKLHRFLLTWLKSDSKKDLSKDKEKFPGFDAATIADLRTSLELFLDDVVWSAGSDFRQLLLADDIFVNDRLAAYYTDRTNSSDRFTKTRLNDDQRAGILTHPYLMANFAHDRQSSPIHRGVFLARGLLGLSLRPPPVAVAPIAPDLHPDLTTRERVTLQTQPASCMTCHRIINPLGFAMEHFDAVGRYRELDSGKPVDDTGSYRTRAGELITVNGARELAEFLADSEEAHAAFAEQMFHHLVQQPVRAYGPETLAMLRQSFEMHDFNIRRLAVDVMATSALVGR